MKQFPVFLNLDQRRCLVLGGNHASQCKVELLLASGAAVEIHTDTLTPVLSEHVQRQEISHHQLTNNPPCAQGCALVIVGDHSLAHSDALNTQCRSLGVPFNMVDQPARCSFTVPSIIDRHPITIAIGSHGQSPMLARRIRAQIETLVPHTVGPLAALLGRYRPMIAKHIPAKMRRQFWDTVLDSDVAEQAISGDIHQAETQLLRALEQPLDSRSVEAKITVIDTRHKNPDKMTLGDVRTLHQIEHLVHDDKVPTEILALARRDTHLHPCAITPSHSGVSRITRQLLRLAKEGEHVALLCSDLHFSTQVQASIVKQLHPHCKPYHDRMTPSPLSIAQPIAS